MKKLNISIYLFILLNISCRSQKVPDLPTIIIDTFGKEIPDEPKITAYMGIINNTTDNNYSDSSEAIHLKVTLKSNMDWKQEMLMVII